MNWKTVVHKNLSESDLLRIIGLKDQHWPYGQESQLLWLQKYIRPDDVHLMGESASNHGIELLAYLTLSNVNAIVDDRVISCFGVGGVCVEKAHQHQRLGSQLLSEAAACFLASDRQGILLCKEGLLPFYERNGWKALCFQHAVVAGEEYEHRIMLFGKACSCSKIIIDRIF